MDSRPSGPALPRRDRAFILTGLLGVMVLAWGYLVAMAADMEGMTAGMAVPRLAAWSPLDWILMLLMWAVMMAAAGNSFGGAVSIAAGLYQLSPLKHRCLEHGAYCVGCCWVLMALLFVGGVMNLLWVAAISGFVLIEKITPGSDVICRVAGLSLIPWGVCTLL